jgi:oligosaccharide repeat unit polymerase
MLVLMNTLPVAGFIFLVSKKRYFRYTGYVVIITLFTIYVVMGNRGYAFSFLITAFWLYNFKHRSVGLVKGLLFAFLVVLFISVFYQLKSFTVQEKFKLHSYSFDGLNPIISLLQEGSATYRSVLYTAQMIPEHKDYDYGVSYVWAISTIMPNFFWDVHPSKQRENPSVWLKWCIAPKMAQQGQGFGFSMIAEGYYNFGIIGVASVMLLVGWSVSRLTLIAHSTTTNSSTIVLAIILHNLLWGCRNAAESIVRSIVWEIMFLCGVYLLVQVVRQTANSLSNKQKGKVWLKT